MRKMTRLLNAVIVAALVLTCVLTPASAEVEKVVTSSVPYDTYVYDYNGNPVITPHAYMPAHVIGGGDVGIGDLTDPSDLEVDEAGNLYVVDTGYEVDMEGLTNVVASSQQDGTTAEGFHGRLIILNPDFSVKKVLTTFANKGKTDGFSYPEGVTISHDNTIYVADTMNGRILRFDQNGKLINEFKEPEISYFDEQFSYKPTKLVVDSSDNMFVIATSVNQGIILLDDQGEFAGFVGAQKVTYSVVDYIWKNLLSEEAQDRMMSFVPTEYNNVKIDEFGFVYTTTSTIDSEDIASAILADDFDTKTSPIKRLNPTGNDVLIRKGYFSTVGDVSFWYDSLGNPETSVIEDVALGPNGRYTLLDSRLNRLFTYSSDGELIYAFRANGYQAGNSKTPVSITYRGSDLLLLDQETGTITVFEPTEYGTLIDQAYASYKKYDYEESKGYWEKVLDENANFDIAYDGIGNALMQQERYREAQEYFRYSNNKDRFSTAWTENRASTIENYLLVIALIAIVVIFLLVKGFGWIGKRNRDPKYHDKHGTFLNQVLYAFYIMIHPFDGFWDVKHEKRGSAKAGTVIVAILIVARVISKFFTNYLFNAAYGTKISIMSEVLIVVMPLLLWSLSNWCVTTLADGEGSMKDVYVFTCYALLPMAIFTLFNTILSHFI
ncbi:MAG: hypothetical protein IKM39_04935, partial [Clostridia bacterium]|nr:hypothetical protein [Clostridia bacterium]